jgi:hypothetical protein
LDGRGHIIAAKLNGVLQDGVEVEISEALARRRNILSEGLDRNVLRSCKAEKRN